MKYIDTHFTEGKKIHFKKNALSLAGLLFLPDFFDENETYPALVITHPGGGVKEQCSSLYGWHLAKEGYVTLAFDASHQGESEGLPRYLEDPTSRVEDIRAAVDYLVSLTYIDEDKIGAMGVCAGAGYTFSAIQTEHRIQAAAGISTWNFGTTAREGFPGITQPNFMNKILDDVAEQRTIEARGGEKKYVKYVPDTLAEIDETTSTIQKEAYDYYRTERCQFKTSVNRYLFTSNDKLAAWDAFSLLEKVAPRPLLFIIGSLADTNYFSEEGFHQEKEPKELVEIDQATHVDLYDKPIYVRQVVQKLHNFFGHAFA